MAIYKLMARLHSPLNAHWLHHIRYELGMNVCIADFLVQELSHCALKLGRDLLRLITL